MAATHELDVSICLDDLGWHFANWYHVELANERLRGLQELGADEPAEIFEQALRIVQPYWSQIGALLSQSFDAFVEWYSGSDLDRELSPLNRRMWDLDKQAGTHGLYHYWISYARKYPLRLEHIIQ